MWDALYRQQVPLDDATALPRALRARLVDALPLALDVLVEQTAHDGMTSKWLWSCVRDHDQIETVLMRYPERATVCVSSQAGCAMGCTFCATGQAGFERHLDAGEIVEQVLRAAQASPQRVSNVVFMGMGEPLANYDNTWAAVHRLHDDLGLSARRITISTVGVVPAMRRLAQEDLPVTLAVSLHARRPTRSVNGSSRSTAATPSPRCSTPPPSSRAPRVAGSRSSTPASPARTTRRPRARRSDGSSAPSRAWAARTST